MYKHILSPVDGSPTSEYGMREAIRLAKDQKAVLRFLYVVDIFYATTDPGSFNIGEFIELFRQSGAEILEKAKATAHAAGVEADSVMAETTGGRVAELIVQAAANWPAEVIVMGTHGRRGISHLFMGSDAEAVARTSPVPVLLVRYVQPEAKAAD